MLSAYFFVHAFFQSIAHICIPVFQVSKKEATMLRPTLDLRNIPKAQFFPNYLILVCNIIQYDADCQTKQMTYYNKKYRIRIDFGIISLNLLYKNHSFIV